MRAAATARLRSEPVRRLLASSPAGGRSLCRFRPGVMAEFAKSLKGPVARKRRALGHLGSDKVDRVAGAAGHDSVHGISSAVETRAGAPRAICWARV